MGILADIAAISADSVQLATDTGTLNTLTAQVTAAQAAIAADTNSGSAANAQLSTDLQTTGPVFVVNTDGTASVYQFSATAPGFTITVATPAS